MTDQIGTVIVIAPAPQVFAHLADPSHLRHYLSGVVPDAAATSDPERRDRPAYRWAFRAEPSAHRLHWQLIAPYHAAGTLDVHGDCSVSQLWLTVSVAPSGWQTGRLHELMSTVLHRIQRRIESDVSTSPRRPALPRTA